MLLRMSVHRSRWAALLPLVLLAVACGGGGDGAPAEGGAGGDQAERGSVVVGSTNFTEQQIVANMYADVLRAAGYDVEERFQLGSREVVLPALESGDIDLYPEYVGTALEFLNAGAGQATSDTAESTELLRAQFAERGVSVLEPAQAQDKNALVVTEETAQRYGLETVSDLKPVAGELVLGGPPECPTRPLCLPGYEQTYGLDFAEFRALDTSGPLTQAALDGGDIDVALMFTTQGVIAENGWVALEDDLGLQPAENVVPVIRTEVVTPEIEELLGGVSTALTTDALTELNRRVDVDGEDPAAVAEEWLSAQGLIE